MLPNIVLIGFMGSGKSAVGRRLAYLTGYRFIDTDDLITERTGQQITEIFAAKGETYFRELETEALQSLVGTLGVIVATGGGAILNSHNHSIFHQIGIVSWIDVDPDLLFARASRNQKRPLLQTEHPRATFDALLKERLPLYTNAATFRIDVSRFNQEQAAKAILDEVRRRSR